MTCTPVEIWPRCGVFRDFRGSRSSCGVAVWLSAFVLIQWRPVWWWPFRVPAGMRCVFSELFFRMGGREESHGNLVVASLSNFQTIACMSPGCARHQQSLALQHQKSLALQHQKSLALQHINRKHESGLRPALNPSPDCPPAHVSLVTTSSTCTTLTTVAPLIRNRPNRGVPLPKIYYYMKNHALTFGLFLYKC
mgnify:CR=1 FL=1